MTVWYSRMKIWNTKCKTRQNTELKLQRSNLVHSCFRSCPHRRDNVPSDGDTADRRRSYMDGYRRARSDPQRTLQSQYRQGELHHHRNAEFADIVQAKILIVETHQCVSMWVCRVVVVVVVVFYWQRCKVRGQADIIVVIVVLYSPSNR